MTSSALSAAPPATVSRAASTAARAQSTSNGWGRPSSAATTRSTLGKARRGSPFTVAARCAWPQRRSEPSAPDPSRSYNGGVKASKAAVREAATVMLVRDAPDLEVFMLRRNPESVFAGGAYVFPGGAVDADDHVLGDDRRFRVAAVRETFEEAGVLLARGHDGTPFDASDDAMVELASDRLRLLAGSATFAAVLDAHAARIDLDALVPFARWITPSPSPRRFDTWFFATAAPHGHAYEHDDHEVVASEWVRPVDALARARAREIELIYPTVRTLLVMARYASAGGFLADARARWHRPDPMRVMNPMQGWQLDLGTLADLEADDELTRELYPARERFAEELSCPT